MWACVMTICLTLQIVLLNDGENVRDVVAGINDHRVPRSLVADDRAIALQRAYGKFSWIMAVSSERSATSNERYSDHGPP